jgi:copper oxidase (laccase) domain-containing protein
MNEHFAIQAHSEVRLLVYRPWWEEGILHGMTLADLDFKGAAMASSEQLLCAAFGITDLAVPQQVHGDRFCDLRSAESVGNLLSEKGTLFKSVECDALIAPLRQTIPTRRVAFGVMTADCVPILVRARNGWAAIHAGWRGLACAVIAKTLSSLEGLVDAAVFAAAGGELYEVGQEVVDAIGSSAVYRKTSDGKYLLDTAATAIRQLAEYDSSLPAESAEICTISDERFHSFRRQGDPCGRSVAFVVPMV